MGEKNKFDKIKYNAEYNKLHNKKFACELRKEVYAEIDEFLKRHSISKAQFVRDSFKKLKEELKDK